MSTPSAGPNEASAKSGVHAVLRYTGIPATWLKRPKLPSRNWLIFLSLTSSVLGLYAYDRRKCRQIRQSYVDRVKHLSEQPLQSWDLSRKATVYGSKWPGDEDYNRSVKYFRKYVKPILVAAAVDYDIVNGKRHGDLTNFIADQIRSRRRLDMGLDKPPPNIIPLAKNRSRENETRRELEGGSVVLGRQTFKEYMEGLKRGWTESLEAVDREEVLSQELEADGRFDEPDGDDPAAALEGEPIPTTSRLRPTNGMPIFSPLQARPAPSRTAPDSSVPTSADAPPHEIPPQPPLLLVPFTNYIGLKQIPLMIYDFFNQRAKVESGAAAAYRLITAKHRPILAPSSFDQSIQSGSEGLPVLDDLDFDRQAESYYKKSMGSTLKDIDKAREEYYKSLPAKLETARALARGVREPTKDEKAYPPPTEVELRAERMKKELRWRSDAVGWEIVRPETGAAWDERFRDKLNVFVDDPQDS